MKYKMINGDLFKHLPKEGDVLTVIPHVCNDIGGWGRGFVLAVQKHYPNARDSYKSLIGTDLLKLGHTNFAVSENEKVVIANMIAQRDIVIQNIDGLMVPPIRYEALEICMKNVADFCRVWQEKGKVQIFCPQFGAGLAGGNWEKISDMINDIWSDFDVSIFVYG